MNINLFIQNFKKIFSTVLLLGFYISEAFSKYSMFFSYDKSDIPRLIKLLVLVFLVFAIVKPIKNLFLPIALLIVFCIGQFFLLDGFNHTIVISFSKFLFPIFLFIYFNRNNQNNASNKSLSQTFEILLVFNGLLIIMGLIFKIYLFKTYTGERFGYNGLFITSATSSYVYAIALFYFLSKFQDKFFKNWKSLLIICCCLLIGTKIIYIALLGVFLIYLFYFNNFTKTFRNVLFYGAIVFAMFLGYFFFFEYGNFNHIRKEQGLISSILSFRDDLFLQKTLPFLKENWLWPNYLFGGISDLSTRSQMGFIDVFFFWGIFGGLFYLYTFYKSYLSFPFQKGTSYFIIILIIMVFLAGNFFENASVAIYLLILKENINTNASKV